MAKSKYDGVVEAVRYDEKGQIAWIRAYLRRGPIFSDRVLLDRSQLMKALKAGEVFVTGERLLYKANTFKTNEPLKITSVNNQDFIVVGDKTAQKDDLTGVPLV